MRNFYLSCKFCILTINLSEVVLPGHIALQIIVFGEENLRNVLNAFQRRVTKNSLTWWCILKTSWKYLSKTSWRRLEDVLETFFKTSSKCLEDVLKMFWRRICKSSWRRLENVLKTSSDNVRLRRTYSSWSRRLR